ncbi:MAG: KpsF/GutQ family sugar-phosphate isomerase [Pseudomonadota bacterium]
MSTPKADASPDQLAHALALARDVLETEAQAVRHLVTKLDAPFLDAIRIILACRGRVVVSGIGKSGHIARKIASTLASTGTPAFFVHPAEAHHGDLGMVTRDDVLLALSNSGESAELLGIVPVVKRQGARLIAITGRPESSLARLADVHLDAGVEREACPLGLAPTASTTAAMALGDALALALLDARGFSAEDFARSHPGGTLGRKLLTRVADVMRTGAQVPAVPENALLTEAILEISRKGMGMTAVVDGDGRLAGIYTDGDLRRSLERSADVRGVAIRDAMTPNPRTIGPEQLAQEAVRLMDQHRINQLVVVDEDGRVVGALNTHDLLHAKVI